ncbi:MAG: hypothetical protein Q7K57_44070 [Burkholderiaceae bacterium]|nr:hypothetical protein [Burkholderiaceae bacterium]
MSFLEDAKSALGEAQFNKLESLARKSTNFETTSEDDQDLIDLKQLVRNRVSARERAGHLSFLTEEKYSVQEVLAAMKATKEDIEQAVKALFPEELSAAACGKNGEKQDDKSEKKKETETGMGMCNMNSCRNR